MIIPENNIFLHIASQVLQIKIGLTPRLPPSPAASADKSLVASADRFFINAGLYLIPIASYPNNRIHLYIIANWFEELKKRVAAD